MARTHQTLASLFSDCADAVREKAGISSTIIADELPDQIRAIPQGDITLESLSVTENGIYTPSAGHAFSEVDVNVSGGGGGGKTVYLTIANMSNEDSEFIFDGVATVCDSNANRIDNAIAFKANTLRINVRDYQSDNHSTYKTHGALTWQSIPTGVDITLTQDMDVHIDLGTCLLAGTLILMANGTHRKIEDIRVGDLVRGYYGAVRVTACDTDMEKIAPFYDEWYFDNGNIIRTAYMHEFYNVTRGEYRYLKRYATHEDQDFDVGEWEIGDCGLDARGKIVQLLGHAHFMKECRHFTIYTEDNTYYADGLLCGNRKSKKIIMKNGGK